MLKLLTSLTLVLATIACNRGPSVYSAVSSKPENSMSSSTSVQIKGVTLQAREEKRLPPGQPPIANRDIGFASVFLQLENAKEADVDVIIQSIQIRSTDVVGSLQMESQNPQTIHLHPLEHSANDIQLTNKTGFGNGSVKAIVTCKIGDRVQVIESDAVAVDRR